MEKSYNLHHFQINGADKQAQAKKSAAATERVDCGFFIKRIILCKPLQKSETIGVPLHSFPIDIPDAIEPL